jgi:type I restriction enzyme S subunit
MEDGPWLITAKDIKNGRINYKTGEKTSWKAFKEELSKKSRDDSR